MVKEYPTKITTSFTFQGGSGDVSSVWRASSPTAKVTETLTIGKPPKPDKVTVNEDGTVDFSFTAWPGPDEAIEYGSLAAMPIPADVALYVGRVVLHCALLENGIKATLEKLCNINKTTLDWRKLSKFRFLITRVIAEADILAGDAPIASSLIKEAAESSRGLHRSRGNVAHGTIELQIGGGEFWLIATGKFGPEKFTATTLRDLALRMSRALFELTTALDPDDHADLRSSHEIQFLRDSQVSNHPTDPSRAKPPHPPQS
ncbi:MAG: hypothetical protein WCS75_12270 [Sphingomonas sp.]|jgi:hypothetical protein|uniref:hypothetical protein n=1 Tax=Sphingomonas sp. TaxID=28214 RepID=UPI003569E732